MNILLLLHAFPPLNYTMNLLFISPGSFSRFELYAVGMALPQL